MATIRYADHIISDASSPLPVPGMQFAPAAERNAAAIASALADLLPAGTRRLLEIASGTGQHAAHLAAAFPKLTIQPSDLDASALISIAAHASALPPAVAARILSPLLLDLCAPTPPFPEAYDAVLAINVLHISEPAALPGLMRCAAAALRPGGLLVCYGPFTVERAATTPSNLAFHEKLLAMQPYYGLRDIADVDAAAAAQGLRVHAPPKGMPANNFLLMYLKAEGGA